MTAFFQAMLLFPIRVYRVVLSPLLPPVCRFHPSCSVYTMGCIAVHGPIRGSFLGFKRLLRCNPFFTGGFEDVPPKNGQSASEILATSHPFIAKQLNEAPPAHLAALKGSARR
jgi:uncharacterized protein